MGPNEGTAPQCFSFSVCWTNHFGVQYGPIISTHTRMESKRLNSLQVLTEQASSLSDAANTSVLVMDIAYKILRNPVLCQRALSSV